MHGECVSKHAHAYCMNASTETQLEYDNTIYSTHCHAQLVSRRQPQSSAIAEVVHKVWPCKTSKHAPEMLSFYYSKTV